MQRKETNLFPQKPETSISRDEQAIMASFNPPKSFTESTPGKYGSGAKRQDIFNQHCLKGVKEVIKTVQQLKSSHADLPTTKIALEKLLETLGIIRKDIAVETQSNPQDIPFFGRSRLKDPYVVRGITATDKTAINNDQHRDSHESVKKLLKAYIPSILKKSDLTATAYDDKENPNSRYVITCYRRSLVFTHTITQEEIMFDDVPENALTIKQYFNDPNYEANIAFPACKDLEAMKLLETLMANHDVKYLVIAEVQLKVGGTNYVTGTKHITWCTDDIALFDKVSEVVVRHTPQASHDALQTKIAELWLQAINWDEKKDGLNKLNEVMADIQYYMGQAMFFYRGSPAVSKMFQKGTYYAHGFLHPATKTPTDEHCTAENYPFIKLYRKKYVACLDGDPTAKRSEEHTLAQQVDSNLRMNK